jgi:hypothetical protein
LIKEVGNTLSANGSPPFLNSFPKVNSSNNVQFDRLSPIF